MPVRLNLTSEQRVQVATASSSALTVNFSTDTSQSSLNASSQKSITFPSIETIQTAEEASAIRQSCVRHLRRQIGRISHPACTLPTHSLRLLNDQINRLLFYKDRLTARLLAMGGHLRIPKGSSRDIELGKNRTYRYYGHAKNLPDVRAVLESRAADRAEQLANHEESMTRTEILKRLDHSYHYPPNHPVLSFGLPSIGMSNEHRNRVMPQKDGHCIEMEWSLEDTEDELVLWELDKIKVEKQ